MSMLYNENDLIKPCPFCGCDKPKIKRNRRPDGSCSYEVIYIQCPECEAKTVERISDGYYGGTCTDQEIIELWNRRVND